MDNVDQSIEAQMHIEKAQREAARVSKELFRRLADYLDGKEISRDIKVSVLCVRENNILFDLRGVDGFDHIEFKIEQTGFGRWIADPKPAPPQADTPIKGAGELASTRERMTAIQAELEKRGYKDCKFHAYEGDPEFALENACEILEAVLDGKTKPFTPFGDTAQREDVSGEKPAVFYCENGKSLEGLEQGALAVLSNLMMKTNATNAEFMIGNEKDGEFYFTCSRTKPTPAPIGAEVGEALADVELCMRDYAYDPLLGRKLRKHLKTIRAALKKGGV